jgi:hypothetical protein
MSKKASEAMPSDTMSGLTPKQWATLFSIAAVGATCSLLFTGFVFGVDTNVFHLPIVGSLFDEPQFKSDSFIQSLRYFASGVWLVLRGAAKHVDPHWLFLGLLFFARWISFVGLMLCATLLGVRGARKQLTFAAFLCLATVLRGESAAGDGGLFENYFGQSEIANGTALITIYYAVRSRLDLTLVFLGATFFVNAFMAVWLFLPLTVLAAFYLSTDRIKRHGLLGQGLVGGFVFLCFAVPILRNMLANPDFGVRPDFDYAAFLAFFYPYHFLANYIWYGAFVELALVAVLGYISLFELGAIAVPFRMILSALLVTYVIGAIVPFFVHSPLILNLHLLRSGVMIYLVAAVASGSLVTMWLHSAERALARVFAPILGAALCSTKLLLPAGLLCIALKRTWTARGWTFSIPRLDWIILAALLVVVWPFTAVHNWRESLDDAAYVTEMTDVGVWANQHSLPTAVFLMPTEWQRKRSGKHPPEYVLEEREIVYAQGPFVYYGRRRLRGSFWEGAAVMWSTSFYHEWRSDIDATLRLKNITEKLAYARANQIDFVLASCKEPDASNYVAAFRTEHICVFAAA